MSCQHLEAPTALNRAAQRYPGFVQMWLAQSRLVTHVKQQTDGGRTAVFSYEVRLANARTGAVKVPMTRRAHDVKGAPTGDQLAIAVFDNGVVCAAAKEPSR